MADKNYAEASSSSQTEHEDLENTVEINIKTLDSQIFSFKVNKNMPVLSLKGKIADAVGIPVGQQRLIFRGKVLKDDHLLSAYHVEDGHTLHLVVRQPVQTENQPGTSSVGAAGNVDNRGSDPAPGAPRNRVGVVGQIAHNVVLGPFNIGDQNEIVVPDLSLIVGAVLSSLGIGAPSATGVGQPLATSVPSSSTQVSQTVETNGTQNASGRTPIENHLPFSPNLFPFQPFNQPQPFHLVTPDSLTTLSAFISRLEQSLSLNGYQSPAPSNNDDSSRSNMPSSSISTLPTPELLHTVMERTQCLLSGQAAAALSHIAGRLGSEGSSTDPAVRGQIQSQAMFIGVAMQHLGALLLELGRTTLMLRMGQSPAESSVNAGPAVYISASGPTPMMVQPTLHTNPLYSFTPSSPIASAGLPGQISLGDALRNVNIHIRSAVAAGGSSAGNRTAAEGSSVETSGHGPASANGNVVGESGPMRGLPPRTVVAAIPARSPAEASVLSVIYPIHVRSQQSNSTLSVGAQGSGPAAEIGSQRDEGTGICHSSSSGSVLNAARLDAHSVLAGNGQVGSSAPGLLLSDALPTSDGLRSVASGGPCLLPGNVEADVANSSGVGSSSEHIPEIAIPPSETREVKVEDVQSGSTNSSGKSSEASTTSPVIDSGSCPDKAEVDSAEDVFGTCQSKQPVEDDKPVPLGLGLGGLQPKRRTKKSKPEGKDELLRGLPGGHDQQSIAMGQQVLQSLVSHADTRTGSGTLTGSVGSRAGSGRVERVHGQGPDTGDTLLGLGRGQGGFDISRMFQQMVPVLSQALGMGLPAPSLGVEMEHQAPGDVQRTQSERKLVEKKSQVDIQQVIERIQHGDSAVNIFRAMLESARPLFGEESNYGDLVDILGSDEELANEFLQMLQRDRHQQDQSDRRS